MTNLFIPTNTTSTSLEMAKIKKTSTHLLNEAFNTLKTNLMVFHFEANTYASSISKIQNCLINHASIDGKDLYILDEYFSKDEGETLTRFFEKATFSRDSYGSQEAHDDGEKPARSMNTKERWLFFSKPPSAIQELYKLLGFLSEKLHADVSTLPWDLCDQTSSSSSVIINKLEKVSKKSMDTGKHKDCNPEKGIPFAIPILYSHEPLAHPQNFINGASGRPYLITVMLYVTADSFNPDYNMGTVFYKNSKDIALKSNCIQSRLVFFESDIIHSIEESSIPESLHTWRVSSVFKLIINPKQETQSVKSDLQNFLMSFPSAKQTTSLGGFTRI